MYSEKSMQMYGSTCLTYDWADNYVIWVQ